MPANKHIDTSTRLRGHGLLSEGKPYVQYQGDEEDARSWHRVHGWPENMGHGVCSCGAASEWLDSDAERKRWHRDHKELARAALTGTQLGEETDDGR